MSFKYNIFMKRILASLLLCIVIQPLSFGIDDIKKVYLQGAIDAAVENNLDLQATKLDIDIAKTT